MTDLDPKMVEECAKAACNAWIDSPPTVDWPSIARAVLTTARQRGDDLSTRLVAAEKVVKAYKRLCERFQRGTHHGINIIRMMEEVETRVPGVK